LKRLSCGHTGLPNRAQVGGWDDLHLRSPWPEVLAALDVGTLPREVQAAAFGESAVLQSRRNLVVSSPTNSGKTLVGLLVLLDAIRNGRRTVLIEPFRAIAQERYGELKAREPQVGAAVGCQLQVTITTGDYRLEDETFADPPPDQGELIIATPERLEAIHRNPANDAWFDSIGAICVDEAHLISDPHRGGTLEYLVTSQLTRSNPPRIVFLSATLGDTARLKQWLAPCDVIKVTERYPPLERDVVALEPDEEKKQVTAALVAQALANPANSVLVFVYQTRVAESLARVLAEHLGDGAGPTGPLAYHSRMSLATKEAVREAFENGQSRCVVTTKALGHGVNLPATHVIVHDVTYPGVGRLEVDDVIQMMGRAGRGDRPGHAAVVVASGDRWSPEELRQSIMEERLPEMVSAYERLAGADAWRAHQVDFGELLAPHVAVLLGRRPDAGNLPDDLRVFFDRSLGGRHLSSHVPAALSWLERRKLAHCEEDGQYKLTRLGEFSTRATLPPVVAAGFAQLMRDLMSLDPDDDLLDTWTSIDSLVCLDLLSDRSSPTRRRFSKKLVEQVDGWMEDPSKPKSMLFRMWFLRSDDDNGAEQVLGSLQVEIPNSSSPAEKARKARQQAYLSVFRSIVLWERGQGTAPSDLDRRWGLKDLAEVEERWRDDMLWILSGLAAILEVKCFFYHLREECEAGEQRIQRVDRILKAMRNQAYDLLDLLKYCSPLGPFLRSLRRSQPRGVKQSVGAGTIRRLEEAGVTTAQQLMEMGVEDLASLGIRRDFAHQIVAHCRKLQL